MGLIISLDFTKGIPSDLPTNQGLNITYKNTGYCEIISSNQGYFQIPGELSDFTVEFLIDSQSTVGASCLASNNGFIVSNYHECFYLDLHDRFSHDSYISNSHKITDYKRAPAMKRVRISSRLLGDGREFTTTINGIKIREPLKETTPKLISSVDLALVFQGTARVYAMKVWDSIEDDSEYPVLHLEKTKPRDLRFYDRGEIKVSGTLGVDSPRVALLITDDLRIIDAQITGPRGEYQFFGLEEKNYRVAYREGIELKFAPQVIAYGDGKLSGYYRVKNKAKPGVIVKVFTEKTDELVKTTVCDNQGNFEVSGLNTEEQFYLVFRDPEGLWEDRVSSRRTPV